MRSGPTQTCGLMCPAGAVNDQSTAPVSPSSATSSLGSPQAEDPPLDQPEAVERLAPGRDDGSSVPSPAANGSGRSGPFGPPPG